MGVRVVLLGKLADGAARPQLEMSAPLNWKMLLDRLPEPLSKAIAGDQVKVAVDGVLLADKTALHAGEDSEVALLPPVSGG